MPNLKYFSSVAVIVDLINSYFSSIGIEANVVRHNKGRKKKTPVKLNPEAKKTEVKPDPPTLTGFALHLGFNSIEELEHYERDGQFAHHVKRARLIIAAEYEKKLHKSYTSGAIFALKGMGWNDKTEDKTALKKSTILTINIIESGPTPASAEKEVIL